MEKDQRWAKTIHETLWEDDAFVLQATRRVLAAMRLAPRGMLSAPGFAAKAVKVRGGAVRLLPQQHRADATLMRTAARCHPSSVAYLDPVLLCDKTFALEIVGVRGDCLQYFSPTVRGDREVVRKATRNNEVVTKFATNDIRGDRSFVMQLLPERP